MHSNKTFRSYHRDLFYFVSFYFIIFLNFCGKFELSSTFTSTRFPNLVDKIEEDRPQKELPDVVPLQPIS